MTTTNKYQTEQSFLLTNWLTRLFRNLALLHQSANSARDVSVCNWRAWSMYVNFHPLQIPAFCACAKSWQPNYFVGSTPVPDPSPSLDDVYHMSEILQPRSKRQKLSYPSGSQPPVAFWDNLSKVWVPKRALRELDRSNAALPLSYRCPPRPIKRPTQSTTTDFLSQCGRRCLKDIKRFARHGGPDLSDLKGVCIAK